MEKELVLFIGKCEEKSSLSFIEWEERRTILQENRVHSLEMERCNYLFLFCEWELRSRLWRMKTCFSPLRKGKIVHPLASGKRSSFPFVRMEKNFEKWEICSILREEKKNFFHFLNENNFKFFGRWLRFSHQNSDPILSAVSNNGQIKKMDVFNFG